MSAHQMRIRFDIASDREIRPRFVNGEELSNWEMGPNLDEYFRWVMDQGWEYSGKTGDEYVFDQVRQLQ